MINLVSVYNSFVSGLSPLIKISFEVLILGLFIALISVFIWKFYRSISQRSFIEINLRKYNRTKNPHLNKFFAGLFYLVENVLLMPFFILLWFVALSVIIILIAPERSIDQILLITAAFVIGIRMLAYYNHEISKDLAKLFPFITLALFVLTPGAFNLERIFYKLSEVPLMMLNVVSFIVVIFVVEILFRIIYTAMAFKRSE